MKPANSGALMRADTQQRPGRRGGEGRRGEGGVNSFATKTLLICLNYRGQKGFLFSSFTPKAIF